MQLIKIIKWCHLLGIKQTASQAARNTVLHPDTEICICSHSDVKKETRPPSPDDVIVLSDNEPSSPLMNGHCFSKTDTDKLMVSTDWGDLSSTWSGKCN